LYTVDQFNERLREEFGGRLRLRPSLTRESTLFLEERTGRATFTGVADLRDRSSLIAKRRADDRIRARDGYSKVMEVQRGTLSACTKCGTPYQVPLQELREHKCHNCGDSFITAFFPLSDVLIDFLKVRDPEHVDQARRVKEESRRHEWLEMCERRSLAKDAGEAFRDNLIEQIPAARYAQRTQMWEDAPSRGA
jgi:predicted  nucleic acid-binding Zn-ribbon protein